MDFGHHTTIDIKLPDQFLTGYFVCGHPDQHTCIELITASVQAGLDAIEIGIPSENPHLDGKVIQKAHADVLNNFCKQDDYISFLQELRSKVNVPIWIMGYFNDVIKSDLYMKLAKTNLVNGFIIPDLHLSQADSLSKELNQLGVSLIPVVNNRMSDAELVQLDRQNDLLYCQLYNGKTGKSITNLDYLPTFYKRVRLLANAKLMGGFGIKNGQLASQVYKSGYDGAVVGSEIVRHVEKGSKEDLVAFIGELASSKTGKEK